MIIVVGVVNIIHLILTYQLCRNKNAQNISKESTLYFSSLHHDKMKKLMKEQQSKLAPITTHEFSLNHILSTDPLKENYLDGYKKIVRLAYEENCCFIVKTLEEVF